MKFVISVDAPSLGPRLSYVLDVLCAWYGWRWEPRSRTETAASTRGRSVVTLSYSRGADPATRKTDAAGVSVRPQGLLEAPPGSSACALRWADYHGVPCPTGLDPLAGIFFCLGLLSEYDPDQTDAHGRQVSSAHPLVARGLATYPVADRLAAVLAQQLWAAAGYLGAPSPVPEASAATSDVDAPRALYGKSPPRRLAAVARAAVATRGRTGGADWSPPAIRAWLRGRTDPFDTFEDMHAAARSRGLPEDIFSLTGYATPEDPGFPADAPAWEQFWRKLPPTSRLGLHPSYHSATRPGLVAEELARLQRGSGREVVASRQHFLRISFPVTFRTLLECGIREDHSLMWADRQGFRAGTARSFPWYDLRREESTALRLVPPHAMDVTARYYERLSPKQAVEAWRRLAEECRASGTALRCIWHNSNLGPWYGWWPWRAAYEASLDLSVIR